MKLTPAQVKNLMRRGLRLLIDPEPDAGEKLLIWEYFENRCAYCDRMLTKGDGDIDHLVSASLGGANALANRVLSCKSCNAEEKRERDWQEFLKHKSGDQDTLTRQTRKIEVWIQKNGGHPVLDKDIFNLLESEAQRTTAEYDVACKLIRESKKDRLSNKR